jgi:hypothetical protein
MAAVYEGVSPVQSPVSSPAPFGHENVRRLDVAMGDPFLVCRVQAIGYLNGEAEQLVNL